MQITGHIEENEKMSIARTLDGKLSATLALIMIIGWLVVDVVEAYPVARPDIMMVAIIIALAVVAFQFYREDRAASKDPVTQKAQIEASVEMFLDKLALHQATTQKQKFDNPLINILEWLAKHEKAKKESEESKESDDPITSDEQFNDALKQAKEAQEGEHQIG
jgi:hypothetical protein